MEKKLELEGFIPKSFILFSKGVLRIEFSSREYTLSGAKCRYESLKKDFRGLLLIAVNNGGDLKVLLPFEGRIKRRNQITRI